MKKVSILLMALVVGTSVKAQLPTNSFQLGYTSYLTKGETNLNGFRVAFWPKEYRYRSLRTNFCAANTNSVGIFVDGVFTPSDSVKANQYQALVGGLIMPIIDPSINVYLGIGSKWNSATGDEYVGEFISTYGVSIVIPDRGLTLSLGRQTIAREMFATTGANTTIGVGYTFRR